MHSCVQDLGIKIAMGKGYYVTFVDQILKSIGRHLAINSFQLAFPYVNGCPDNLVFILHLFNPSKKCLNEVNQVFGMKT